MADYKDEIRILRKALRDKKLIVFVGAGISIGSGMPSWGQAVKKIAELLGFKSKNLTSDDYLKIPQYYYNARGKKEYVETMRDIFKANENLKPNETHRKIIDLNTHTIITTNYDNLINQAANERHAMVQNIAQNKDLPYKSVEREIIKIHGDFEHDNFVLKEDDYIHYSSNFTLIEAYVKSLIATNTILFVGYSFTDPDIKQVFSWVKDILEDDFQRAYLLDVENVYDYHTSEYYKHLGVNIIFTQQISGFDSLSLSERASKFIDLLTDPNNEHNLEEKINTRCLAYKDLNFIRSNYIAQIFNEYFPILNKDLLMLFNRDPENNLEKILHDAAEKNNTTSLVKSTLSKSMISKIQIREKLGIENRPIINYNTQNYTYMNSDLFIYVQNFDYRNIRHLRDTNECLLSNTTPELYLQQAYLSYILCDYFKAYNYLKICSELFYYTKQYTWYMISEFNRLNIGKLLEQDFIVDDSIRQKVSNEIATIDLDIIFDSIPDSPSVSKELLKDIYTYRMYYSSFQEIYLISKKAIEETTTQYVVKDTPSYEEMRMYAKDSYYFELYNFIMFDQYLEKIETYRLFAKTILESSLCDDQTSNSALFANVKTSNVHIHELEAFDIQIIIKYLRIDDLQIILKSNSKKRIVLSEDATNYISNICNNLGNETSERQDYFWNLVCLIGQLKLDEGTAIVVLKNLRKKLNDRIIGCYNLNILKMLYSFFDQNIFNNELCLDELSLIINDLCKIKSSQNSTNAKQINKIIKNALFIAQQSGIDNSSLALLELTKNDDLLFLADIYPLMESNIKRSITKKLKKSEFNDSPQGASLYTEMVISGIIEPDEQFEVTLFKKANDSKEPAGIKSNPSNEKKYEECILSLYLNEKIINTDSAKSVLTHSDDPVKVWLSQIDTYDYSNFDLEWLTICSDNLLKHIAGNDMANKAISERIKQSYTEEQSLDDKTIEIFFKYFLKV